MARRKQQSTFERLTSGKLNRKQRKELIRRIEAEDPGLEIVCRNAAGIDVGNESHMVSVPADRDAKPIREFGSWTKDLQEMADWLKANATGPQIFWNFGEGNLPLDIPNYTNGPSPQASAAFKAAFGVNG